MADDSAGEKTEKATDHKRREERKKGNVMLSKDIVAAVFIIATFAVLRIFAQIILKTGEDTIAYWMSIAGQGMGINGQSIDGMQFYAKLVLEIGKVVVITAGPVLLVSTLVTIVATGAQTRFVFSTEPLKFKMDKMNPIKGIKNMFSLASAFELAKSLAKMILLAVIVYGEIQGRISQFARLFEMDLLNGLVYMADTIYSIVMKIALVFVAVAVADVLFQYFKFEKDMKMTKQEVKEEYKSLEGNQEIKGKRRQIQRQMASKRMMQSVPDADVVIRNPTHFAIAIKYDDVSHNAPIVLAKGADNIAFKIIDIAKEHDITMVENRPLARGLYDSVEVGKEIPPDFYHAVAEVLVFVYNLREQKKNLY